MKLRHIFSIFVLFAALMFVSALNADCYAQRHNRRVKKVYTSPETIKAQQDSLKRDSIIVAAGAVDEEPTEVKPRGNTLQQIDSVLAMWRATTTVEAYENYFNRYVAVCERIDSAATTTNIDSIYVERLNALLSPVPLQYNHEVRAAINRYTTKEFAPMMGYAYYYFPMIEEELIRAGLPVELRALAIIESGLNPLATSRMGAKGLWQFMPSTGKEYGLEINSLIDERCNPRLATRAACQYLKNMYNVYGDWTLAIASYNCGPGNVNKAIIRAGGNPRDYHGSFWDVYSGLPRETRSYVPLFMGATYAFAYHKKHNMELPVPPMPLAVDTVMIDRPMHLEQISSTIDISLELLQMLNPEYRLSIIPATTKQYPLTLPTECITEFIINQDSIFAKDSLYLKEYVIHANIEKKRHEAPPATYHTVKKGDTLGAIARKYGRTVKQLMQWNNLKNANSLRIGQRLRVSAQ
ncbi:MAG: transglycosylase SLT domain-containing protein [Alistipes sp.]|nr:transglycosylase SLT domain-containing protein [Paludibacteraceae bacterium]MBO5831882.1 transglycosylase SLT domain-containing protein [Alistipes sp.]